MNVPNKKSFTDEAWEKEVKRQHPFWHDMNDMMGVHLVEAAEFLLEQKDQSLIIDAIGDTMLKIQVLHSLLEEFQHQETLVDREVDVKETLDNIRMLGAGTARKDVDKVEAAYRSMLARSQINKEDKEHE